MLEKRLDKGELGIYIIALRVIESLMHSLVLREKFTNHSFKKEEAKYAVG